MPDIEKVRDAIQKYEYYQISAGGRLSGVSVKVDNVRLIDDFYYADVTSYTEDEVEEKFKDAYYPVEMFKDIGESQVTQQWLERWHRRASMDRQAQPPLAPEGPEEGMPFANPHDPFFLKTYLNNFKKVMKKQMPNVPDAELFQDAFVQMIELLLPDDKKHDLDYLNKIVGVAAGLQPPISLTIPTDIHTQVETKQVEKEEAEERKLQEEKQKKEKEKMGTPLEEQLANAIADERYEDAKKIQEQIDRLKKIMGKQYHGTLHKGDIL